MDAGALSRAQGCLLGQLAGDSLASLVEFESPQAIRARYPNGVLELAGGGTWGTVAGQPTDDSEMALALARTIVARGGYDVEAARSAYVRWLDSRPFDCGSTVRQGLTGRPNEESQGNGALMRISPLGIFGHSLSRRQVSEWAWQDAGITHPHPVCRQANSLFACAIAHAIRTGCGPGELYQEIRSMAQALNVLPALD